MNKKLSCKKCNGKGFISERDKIIMIYTEYKERVFSGDLDLTHKIIKAGESTWAILCPLCDGNRYVTWIDEIMGRNTPPLKIVIKKANKNE